MTIPHSLTYSATMEAVLALRMRQHAGQDIAQMSESEIIATIIKAGIKLSDLNATFADIRKAALHFEALAQSRKLQ